MLLELQIPAFYAECKACNFTKPLYAPELMEAKYFLPGGRERENSSPSILLVPACSARMRDERKILGDTACTSGLIAETDFVWYDSAVREK